MAVIQVKRKLQNFYGLLFTCIAAMSVFNTTMLCAHFSWFTFHLLLGSKYIIIVLKPKKIFLP